MNNPLKLVLVGIGGYGNSHVAELLDTPRQHEFTLAGAVDPSPQNCRRLEDLKSRGVAIHSSLESFYETSHADLAIISAPIHLHAKLTRIALAHGSNVLCEKPLCATPGDAKLMKIAQDQSARLVAIGYQWSFSLAIQSLQSDVRAGVLGRARRLKSLVLWPRDMEYYHRNAWAGAIDDGKGNWVFDSPVNNACAHYLHNMFYVLGSGPEAVKAETYRIHPIQNYDTAAVRCLTTDGAELFFVTSHATVQRKGPDFYFEFDRAVVTFSDGGSIIARFKDGSVKDYGSPDADRTRPLWQTMEAIHRGTDSVCGIAATLPQVQCNWAIQQSGRGIAPIPAGRDADLIECYEQWKLPSELGLPWGRA